MSDTDAERILGWIDSALELFQKNQGHLTAREISVRSMLAVVRNDMAESLEKRAQPRGHSRQ